MTQHHVLNGPIEQHLTRVQNGDVEKESTQEQARIKNVTVPRELELRIREEFDKNGDMTALEDKYGVGIVKQVLGEKNSEEDEKKNARKFTIGNKVKSTVDGAVGKILSIDPTDKLQPYEVEWEDGSSTSEPEALLKVISNEDEKKNASQKFSVELDGKTYKISTDSDYEAAVKALLQAGYCKKVGHPSSTNVTVKGPEGTSVVRTDGWTLMNKDEKKENADKPLPKFKKVDRVVEKGNKIGQRSRISGKSFDAPFEVGKILKIDLSKSPYIFYEVLWHDENPKSNPDNNHSGDNRTDVNEDDLKRY